MPLATLKKYWKHPSFRPLQEEIITAVLEGNDTFAILPTGGGKSVCYQVPGMVLEGITLVVSPLIALLQDQVSNLQKKNIKAMALVGGISVNETLTLLDNCLYGNYKFLYLSPEKLQQDWVREKIRQLPINLIAIDEAHCVSQWGHDFRPAYLKIKLLKEYFSSTPFIALTASATLQVQKDCITQLQLQQPKVFKQSFYRKNLAYNVIITQDKLGEVERLLQFSKQAVIIYVRTRRMCVETAEQLDMLGYATAYYHGGLSVNEKEKSRLLWMHNKKQIMVATNAFGMGIDKPDVATIIHLQIPQNLENYYQEVGRAGRAGQKAAGFLLTHTSEIQTAEKRFKNNELTKATVKEVYKKLNTYFSIAYGEGINEQFYFNIQDFCKKYNLSVFKTFKTLQFLHQQGVVTFGKESGEKINVKFLLPSRKIIQYANRNPTKERVISAILRTYSGIFDVTASINLNIITKKTTLSKVQIITILQQLHQEKIINLQLITTDSSVIFNEIREDDYTINRISKYLKQQNQIKEKQFKSMLHFITDTTTCKSELLMRYFGEQNTFSCSICSCCESKKMKNEDDYTFKIRHLLQEKPYSAKEIALKLKITKEPLIFALQMLLEQNKIKINSKNKYQIV